MTQEELEGQIDLFTKRYEELHNHALSAVVIWKWSKKQYFSAEPFFNEKQNKKPAKLLKVAPVNEAGYIKCGFDTTDHILIEREIHKHDDNGWDRIFLHDKGHCIWELAFSKNGEIQYGRYFHWENDRLSYYHHKHFFGDIRFFREEYFYEENIIRSSSLSVVYPSRGDQSKYDYTYIYNSYKEIDTITADIEHSYARGYKDLIIYKKK